MHKHQSREPPIGEMSVPDIFFQVMFLIGMVFYLPQALASIGAFSWLVIGTAIFAALMIWAIWKLPATIREENAEAFHSSPEAAIRRAMEQYEREFPENVL